MDHEQINRLNQIAEAAREYAAIANKPERTEALRDQRFRIVEAAACFTPLEVAYFCQQISSYFADVCKASMELTVFTNRLMEAIERKEQPS